jgi:4-aminobutyrate aminotransferase
VLQSGNLIENCASVGAYFKSRLQALQLQYPSLIVDVRGIGLALGMEMIDPHTGRPGTEQVATYLRLCKEEGVLVGSDGKFAQCVKIRPPLILTRANVDRAIDGMGRAMRILFEFETTIKGRSKI